MAEINFDINWREYMEQHKGDIAEAAKLVEDGDTIFMSSSSGIPYRFLDYLNEHYEEFHNVTLTYNCMNVATGLIFNKEIKNGHFRLWSAFNLPLERASMGMDIVECGGMSYDMYLLAGKANSFNAAAFVICPPDENGWCNVGCNNSPTYDDVINQPNIKKIIGFIDPTGQYPSPGDFEKNHIHVTQLDCIVDYPTVFAEIPPPVPVEVDKIMADIITPYIKPGDKIQIGWGGLGEEVLANLRGIGGIEFFTEVACDTMRHLVDEGVATRITASGPSACPTSFFEWAATNSRINFYPMSMLVNPVYIGEHENIVAINSVFQIDLIGQACAEAQGLTPYTGPGGSFAYYYGAIRSKGGRSFMCVRSTHTENGEVVSNIFSWLPEGCIVTITKVFAMYIVSEYGVADVFLKPLKTRILRLIKLAHPDFREELKKKICATPLITEKDFEGIDLFDCDFTVQ